MAKKIRLTVVTVCFNAEKTISAAIKSVLSQGFNDFEYIIKDGASKDNTLSIVSKYGKKIAKVISGQDKGLYDAMNIAVKKAKGEYIYFLNADDALKDKHVFEKVTSFLDSENDLVFGDIEFFYPEENSYVRVSRKASIEELKKGNMPPHQGSFVKRSLLLAHPFNTKYRSSADFDFFCRVLASERKVKKIGEIIAIMTMGGISSGKVSYKETEAIIKQYFGFLAFLKILLKHKLFSLTKRFLLLVGIKLHKG